MGTRAVFVGDEVTAAGYRLAGAEVHTPDPAHTGDVLRGVLEREPPLVLVTMECLQALDGETLARMLADSATPLLPVPDAAGRVPLPDLAAWLRERIVA